VVPYLEGLALSPQGQEKLVGVLRDFAASADVFVHDSNLRLAPDSDCFQVEWVFRDPATRVVHVLRLIVSDAAASFGVLRVVYAELLP
jgi:hypothetical protein